MAIAVFLGKKFEYTDLSVFYRIYHNLSVIINYRYTFSLLMKRTWQYPVLGQLSIPQHTWLVKMVFTSCPLWEQINWISCHWNARLKHIYWIYSTMDHFRTVGISRFQFRLILQICNCKDVIELTSTFSRQDVRLYFKKTNFFQNKMNKNMRQFGVAHEI